MKKINIFKITLTLTILIVFSSCATNKFTYDRTVLEEQQCIIIIPKEITVVKFNEKTVNWKVGYNIIYSIIDSITQKKREAFVKVPEGEHTMIVNYLSITNTPTGYNTYVCRTVSAEGITVTGEFQHGNTYSLMPLIIGDKITIMVRKH